MGLVVHASYIQRRQQQLLESIFASLQPDSRRKGVNKICIDYTPVLGSTFCRTPELPRTPRCAMHSDTV